jgi:hypothetical protein
VRARSTSSVRAAVVWEHSGLVAKRTRRHVPRGRHPIRAATGVPSARSEERALPLVVLVCGKEWQRKRLKQRCWEVHPSQWGARGGGRRPTVASSEDPMEPQGEQGNGRRTAKIQKLWVCSTHETKNTRTAAAGPTGRWRCRGCNISKAEEEALAKGQVGFHFSLRKSWMDLFCPPSRVCVRVCV